MAKKQSPDNRPARNVKKGLNLKKNPAAGKSGKSAGSAKSSSKLTASPSIESRPAEQARSKEKSFFIVGIGASAGGLEAFTKLLENLPPDTGMAFVLVQHLAPTQDSMLSELLSKATSIPVREVQDGMTVEPDHAYVIPPNTVLEVFHGKLRLLPRTESHGQHLPIDSFFRSLAEDQGQNAVGIILSGTGSDGSLGIRAIKAEGGIVLAQDEQSAKYDGMPKSAVATGAVDYVLPPEKIAAELVRISRHPVMNLLTAMKDGPLLQAGEDDLNKIFMRIRTATGVDFTYYKRATILRRINRRMLVHKIEALAQYVRYLQENPTEIGVLYQDILINVTSFFRDPETFTTLKKVVFPRLLENRSPDTPLRIWVPGCSTGEEAYSLAMCFSEFTEERSVSPQVQFFASDIDEAAIDKARQGVFPDNIVQDVSPERLRRFFAKVEQGYQISKAIREQCVFARQNLIKDPPFSKMDLISCRNLMIYFGPMLQKKALPIMHYSLNPSGYLMLGKSESIGEFADLFSLVDKNSRIYSKKTTSSELHFDRERGPVREKAGKKKVEEHAAGGTDIQRETDSIILNRYSPAGLVINEDMDILQFRGNISPYLKPRPGKASLNLMKMAGESLAMELRVLIRQAAGKDVAVRKEGINFWHNNIVATINIEVVALKPRDSRERLFLVLFEDTIPPAVLGSKNPGKSPAKAKGHTPEDQVAPLARELAATQQHLRSIIAEHEASTEELKALNEEVQSSNEELQSINEELETSKEELQSTNEELNTVNDELQNRNEEITQSNNDLVNVLSGVEIPILLIGNKLQIRRFNASAGKALNLIATDIGRPISDIRSNINVPDLDKMILEVIDTLTVREQEIQDTQGRWYSMTIRPYKTVDNRIDGALVTLEDINDLKLGMMRIQEARDYAEAIVETVREPLLVLDSGLRVLKANRSFYDSFKVTPGETIGKLIYDLGNRQWDIPWLRTLLEEILPKDNKFDDYKVEHAFLDIGHKVMLLNARRITQAGSGPQMILLAIEDITEKMRLENELAERTRDAKKAQFDAEAATRANEDIIETVREPLLVLDSGLRVLKANRSFYDSFKVTPGETIGKLIYDLGNRQWDIASLRTLLEEILPQDNKFDDYEVEHVFSDIGHKVMLLNARRITQEELGSQLILLAIEDVTKRRQAVDELQVAHAEVERQALELAATNKELEAFSYSVSHDLRAPLRSVSSFTKIVFEDYADKLDAQGRDYLARIKNGSDRMSQLIADLLRLSHISLQDIERMDYDLSRLASDVMRSLRETDPARNVEVVIAEGLRAVVDPNLMRIAITNLISNAWKFTSKIENARIEFGAVEKEAKIVYFVKDNGDGFDPAYVEKMFLPFQRLHSEEEFEGTGIGLAIVERIISRHGGKIWAEGKRNEGAAFFFTLS